MYVDSDLLPKMARWFERSSNVQSAVLFGSAAREGSPEQRRAGSDLDFHIVASDARRLENVIWANEFRDELCRLQVARSATGGVRKVTVVFAAQQMDLVIVPARMLRFGALALRVRLDRQFTFIRRALNEMATCLHTGYRFVKGEERWGKFYAAIARLDGVRLSQMEVQAVAGLFLCDLLWVLQKLERGELVAAQHVIHSKLADVNLRLWRELRFRRKQPLPSFGLGRRVEVLAPRPERDWLEINARLSPDELADASWSAFQGLCALMRELQPEWAPPASMVEILQASHARVKRLRD